MSLWDNEDAEPWDENVPPDLIPAIKFLRDSFDRAHSTFGLLVTMPLCYSQLHNGAPKSGFDDIDEYIKALVQLKSRIGRDATKRFHDLLTQGTLPAIFKGFFDFYLEGVKVQALLTFHELLGIGRSNEFRLNRSHVEWAEAQTRHLICSQRHCITLWVQYVCDDHPYDPNEDQDEQIFWRKWQAPAFLIMKPSRFGVYDSTRVWERTNSETSSRWLEALADHYVLVLESAVKDAAGHAALELAKQPKPVQPGSTGSDFPPSPPKTSAQDTENLAVLLSRMESATHVSAFRTDEAARVLQVSKETVNRWARDDKLARGSKRGTILISSIKRKLGTMEKLD
ncbi:MAG: helix-turn-helix domain-containing protein [Terracidiphilus sp.]